MLIPVGNIFGSGSIDVWEEKIIVDYYS